MNSNIKNKTEAFFGNYPVFRFKKGNYILKPGDDTKHIFYLRRGYIKQFNINGKGEGFLVHIFKPGSFFHMTWIVNKDRNEFYYQAVNNVEVYKAPVKEVVKFLENEPVILMEFTKRLLRGVSGMIKRFNFVVQDEAYKRVVKLLGYYADRFGEKDTTGILIKSPITHKDIAAWIGTTRETASLQMELLKKKGIICYRGRKLIINNLDVLNKENIIH